MSSKKQTQQSKNQKHSSRKSSKEKKKLENKKKKPEKSNSTHKTQIPSESPTIIRLEDLVPATPDEEREVFESLREQEKRDREAQFLRSKEFKKASSILNEEVAQWILKNEEEKDLMPSILPLSERQRQKAATAKVLEFQKRLLAENIFNLKDPQTKHNGQDLKQKSKGNSNHIQLEEEFEPPSGNCLKNLEFQKKQDENRGVFSGLHENSSKTKQLFYIDRPCIYSLFTTEGVPDWAENKVSTFLEDVLEWNTPVEETSREVVKEALRFGWPNFIKDKVMYWGTPYLNSLDQIEDSVESSEKLRNKFQQIDSLVPEPSQLGTTTSERSSSFSSSSFSSSSSPSSSSSRSTDGQILTLSELTKKKTKKNGNSKTKSEMEFLTADSITNNHVFFDDNFYSLFWTKPLKDRKEIFQTLKNTKDKNFALFFLNRKIRHLSPLFQEGVFHYMSIEEIDSKSEIEIQGSIFDDDFNKNKNQSNKATALYIPDSSIPVMVTLAGMFPLGKFIDNSFGLNTLTHRLGAIQATVVMKENQDELIVRSSTVYGALVKFALACLYASNFLCRSDLQSQHFEKEMLMKFMDSQTQDEAFTETILNYILPYQKTGLLLSEAKIPQSKQEEDLQLDLNFQMKEFDFLFPLDDEKTKCRPGSQVINFKIFDPFFNALDRDLFDDFSVALE